MLTLSRSILTLAVAFVVLTSLGGCNIVAPVALLVHGPAKTEAMFTLPPDKPVVVFVDDRNSVLPSRAIRQRIAKEAEKALVEGKVLTADLISSDAILPVAASERFSKPKSIAEIGRTVGAKTIIYATVDTFTLTVNGAEYSPLARLRVKVIDAEDEKRLWPSIDKDAVQQWYPLEYSVPTKSAPLPRNSSERTLAEQSLADRVGRALANLFIKHETREANERIGQ